MPWTADRRLYLTEDDQVVEEGDERATRLLVGAEGVVDDETVKRYKLKSKPAPEEKAKAPAENKAKKAPPEDK